MAMLTLFTYGCLHIAAIFSARNTHFNRYAQKRDLFCGQNVSKRRRRGHIQSTASGTLGQGMEPPPPRPCNELVTPPASCLKACGLGSSTPSTPTPAALQGKSGQTLDEWTFMISKQSHLHLFWFLKSLATDTATDNIWFQRKKKSLISDTINEGTQTSWE